MCPLNEHPKRGPYLLSVQSAPDINSLRAIFQESWRGPFRLVQGVEETDLKLGMTSRLLVNNHNRKRREIYRVPSIALNTAPGKLATVEWHPGLDSSLVRTVDP